MLSSLRSWLAARLRRRLGVPLMDAALQRLAANGFVARGVYDIGAYRGDFAAMARACWPDATITCFEPQPGKGEVLRGRFRADARVLVREDLLAAEAGTRHLLALAETAASILEEHAPTPHARVERIATTLDALRATGAIAGPADLIKLDTQGSELAILQGGAGLLAEVQALVIELNLLDIHRGVPLLHEVTSWLAARGFVAYDIAGLTRRPLDSALWQMDLVFVRPDSVLRADKRWSKP